MAGLVFAWPIFLEAFISLRSGASSMNSLPQNDGVILVCAQLDRNLVDEVSVSLLLSVACGRRFCSLRSKEREDVNAVEEE